MLARTSVKTASQRGWRSFTVDRRVNASSVFPPSYPAVRWAGGGGAADGERADRAAERGNHIRSMMENSAAAKVAAGDDVTRWRASARLASVRG